MAGNRNDVCGRILCDHLTHEYGMLYSGLKEKVCFNFFTEEWGEHIGNDWQGKRQTEKRKVKDSRQCPARKIKVTWEFGFRRSAFGKEDEIPDAWIRLGKLLMTILSERFTDLLYLEEVEKELKNNVQIENRTEEEKDKKKDNTISVVEFFLKDILDKKRLVDRYAFTVMKDCGFPDCDLLIHISAQHYEKRALKSRMYIVEEGMESSIHFEIDTLENNKEYQIIIENLRTIRKLMEMSGEAYGLMVCRKDDEYWIKGIVNNNKGKSSYIDFDGFLKWTAVYGNQSVLEYQAGNYRIPGTVCDEDKDGWRKELENLKDIVDVKSIEKSIEELIKSQSHGTSIVFMSDKLLEKELARLQKYKRTYQVRKFPIVGTEDALKGITSMDGALLADLQGNCHAVGAILDGEMVEAGNPGRGARFNSIGNYVRWVLQREEYRSEMADEICFAAVLSEDRMVNLQISKHN